MGVSTPQASLQDESFKYKYGKSDYAQLATTSDTLVHDTASGATFYLRELTLRNNSATETAVVTLKDASAGNTMWKGAVFPGEMVFLTFSSGLKFVEKDVYASASTGAASHEVEVTVAGVEK